MAKAEFFPKLDLTALFGTASPEMSALTSGARPIWAVGRRPQRPPVQRGPHARDLSRVGRAVGAGAARSTSRRSLIALREVSDALTALGKLSDAETGQDRSVTALEEAVEHATDRYR